MSKIKLGDRVRDSISGLTGIVAARTEYLNGCIQYAVASQDLHDGAPIPFQWIDEGQLEVLPSDNAPAVKRPASSERSGGPQQHPSR